jgi:thiazole synthase ThiGH ThiG subunit
LEHINLFRQACLITKEILDAEKPEETPIVTIFPLRPKYLTKEEAQSILKDYRKRYKAQLPNTRGTHPDPEAPIDKTTLAPKRYARLDNFIRSMVYQSIKTVQSAQQLTE